MEFLVGTVAGTVLAELERARSVGGANVTVERLVTLLEAAY
ncbi:MAG TPA: hypothetical protein VIX59_05560 [Candidatus Binataceae bacterium]